MRLGHVSVGSDLSWHYTGLLFYALAPKYKGDGGIVGRKISGSVDQAKVESAKAQVTGLAYAAINEAIAVKRVSIGP